jgi:hypothetical protein
MTVLIVQLINFFSDSSLCVCVFILVFHWKKYGVTAFSCVLSGNNAHVNSLKQCIQIQISIFRFWEVNIFDSSILKLLILKAADFCQNSTETSCYVKD